MQYMVRVEIHKADRETYDRLHAAMAAEFISRTMTGTRDGKNYHMPIGTYWTETAGDAWTVLEAAKRAALTIDAGAEIVVSGAGQIVFFNCPEVVPEPFYASLLGSLFAQASTSSPYGRLTDLVPSSLESSYLTALLGTPNKG